MAAKTIYVDPWGRDFGPHPKTAPRDAQIGTDDRPPKKGV